VARVFPAERRIDEARQDADILRFLAVNDIRAERCAHAEPVSVLHDQSVLVTEEVPGLSARTDTSARTLSRLGDTLGRLHALPGGEDATRREAGAWHHISVNGGGLRADVQSLLPLLAEAEARLTAEDDASFRFVLDTLRGVDGCADLPQALIHSDPCGANAVIAPDGAPVLVDWTGAGRGPRALSLGALIAGAFDRCRGIQQAADLSRVDAIIAGYRTHVRLTQAESARLAAAITGGCVVLDCWSLLFQNVPVRMIARSIANRLAIGERAAERAVDAFDLDHDVLTGDPLPAVHPGQAELF
jgi:Ser/Thr protein kinase RdoA (MazF antagonist)